jgi:diaminopimelate epimerase
VTLESAKLHGAGNDFLVFDGGRDATLIEILPALAARLCHRHIGLGADGVLLLVPGEESHVRLYYWNADGSRAAFCANGTRCAARFVADRWGWGKSIIETDYATIPAAVEGCDVTLELPAPTDPPTWLSLEIGNEQRRGAFLIVGVPHLIVPVDWPDFWHTPLAPLAPALRAHPALPSTGANVSFLRLASSGELEVRSWERGIEGETLSCGSGDVAAALVALAEGWSAAPVRVRTASGRLLVVAPSPTGQAGTVLLTGPAEWVADLSIGPELLK